MDNGKHVSKKTFGHRRTLISTALAAGGAVAVVVSLVAGPATASSGAVGGHRAETAAATRLTGKLGTHVTRTGTVDIATMPHASAGNVQKLTAAQQKAFDRPLKTAAQIAAYRNAVLSGAFKVPASPVTAAAPAPKPPTFLSSNLQIPQLVTQGDGINFTQSGCGCTPPDQAVGVSVSGIMFEGVNNLLTVYNGSLGTLYGPVSAQTFFAPLYHSGDFFSDPQITYDAERGRWLVAWLEINSAGTADYIDLAVSKTSSNYSTNFYEYQIPANASGASDFCDYDTLGYDYYGLWIACTSFNGSTGAFTGNRVFGFPLSQMSAGSLSDYVYYYNVETDLSGGTQAAYRLSPAIEDGTPQAEFVTASDAGFGVTSSNLTVCAITNTVAIQHGSLPDMTCGFNTMPLGYADPINAPQPGTSSTVYPGFGTKQLEYYDGRLWLAMPSSLSCGGTTEDGIWWGDVTPQLTPISSGYPQSVNGIVSNYTENAYLCYSGGLYSYLPSIQPSGQGDAALVYNLSASSTWYPSIVYTGRMAADAPGDMGSSGQSAVVVAGSSDNTTGRFGDYSACALATNFVVRNTLWCGGEYGGSDVWNTRLYELRMQ
jgi:hypothetical protein